MYHVVTQGAPAWGGQQGEELEVEGVTCIKGCRTICRQESG